MSQPPDNTPHSLQAADQSAVRTQPVLARQDRIPVWSLPVSYLVIIGVGYLFTFFDIADIADIGYAMPSISA